MILSQNVMIENVYRHILCVFYKMYLDKIMLTLLTNIVFKLKHVYYCIPYKKINVISKRYLPFYFIFFKEKKIEPNLRDTGCLKKYNSLTN